MGANATAAHSGQLVLLLRVCEVRRDAEAGRYAKFFRVEPL